MTTYYVHRHSPTEPGHSQEGWVGPIRSQLQAERERVAWVDAGWQAEVCPSTAEVRAQVRGWQRRVKATR